MNFTLTSGHESKNLRKTNDETQMKENSGKKTTDLNDAVKDNAHVFLTFLK